MDSVQGGRILQEDLASLDGMDVDMEAADQNADGDADAEFGADGDALDGVFDEDGDALMNPFGSDDPFLTGMEDEEEENDEKGGEQVGVYVPAD